MLELERCDGFETPPLADIVSVLCTSEGTMVKPLLMVRVTEGNVAAGRSLNILRAPGLEKGLTVMRPQEPFGTPCLEKK